MCTKDKMQRRDKMINKLKKKKINEIKGGSIMKWLVIVISEPRGFK